jgi:hypothetical protein
MKPRGWMDLVRAIWSPSEIQGLIKAGEVKRLLEEASSPEMSPDLRRDGEVHWSAS